MQKQFDTIQIDQDLVRQIQSDIQVEICKAAKIPQIPLLRRIVCRALEKPVIKFSSFIARVDALIGEYNFMQASEYALTELAGLAEAKGAQNVPMDGPVIIASNHPGTYDGFVLISSLKRNDFKMIVSGIPFFRNLPNAEKYLIYSTRDVNGRMEAIRRSIRHLQSGGALIIYPSGRIDPDPAVLPGAEDALEIWSRSIEVFLRKVPEAELVLAITSGVLSEEFINHPFTRFFPNNHERRRIMEFMQMIKQMVRGKPVDLDPKISFSKPIQALQHMNHEFGNLRDQINVQAKILLRTHISDFSLEGF